MPKNKPVHPANAELYMAFPDGVFHYVCAECNALCCRGDGFGGSLEKEFKPLFQIYPALQSLVTFRKGDEIHVSNPSGRCMMLDDDRLCHIEKEHGRSVKPGVCALFPFSSFRRLGNDVAIIPNFLCPLRVQVPARPNEVEGTHAEIEAAVRASAYFEACHPNLHPLTLPPSLNAREVVQREKAFRDVCAAALGKLSFTDVLLKASINPTLFLETVERGRKLLGLPTPLRERDGIDDLLLAIAPSHRLSLLTLQEENILIALALGEAHLRQTLSISDHPLNPQGTYKILTDFVAAIRLLARGDEPLGVYQTRPMQVPHFNDAALTFAGIIALRKINGGAGILSALEEAFSSLTIADRTFLLLPVGSQLESLLLQSWKKVKRGKSSG
jgi:Fe-S-cluster containining protein